MKKSIGLIILLSVMCCPSLAQSQSAKQFEPGFVLLDVIFYRPVGLAITIIGTGVFIGISPLTALASIPEPHDAFTKTRNILILAPAAYTFIRPIGDRNFPFYVPQYQPKPVTEQNNIVPYNNHNPVISKQRSIVPPAPAMRSPQPYPSTKGGL